MSPSDLTLIIAAASAALALIAQQFRKSDCLCGSCETRVLQGMRRHASQVAADLAATEAVLATNVRVSIV